MFESWVINGDDPASVSSETVREVLRSRIDRGPRETWLASSSGRSLAFVTNTERAMVILLEEEGDPGEHATDAGAEGTSSGFVLSNGQRDKYLDQDTVPIREAFELIEHILGTGSWPADARWAADR
ncbi:hypothetical protein ACFVVU_38560 [Kitasatospora sp. NPDC057965]|uniref:hypothetical protein n=1 Tax=Kitasatospora sp. NPDC057965 TaxID=3346291 RepID=UPI0036DCA353